MTVFVDTSAWYAAADADDRSHQRAASLLREFSGDLLTTDHVLVETWYLTRARLGASTAERLLAEIRAGIARIENTELSDLEVAAAIADRFSDQDFSIVDRTCWSVMLRLGVHEAIAFDRDYSIFRHGPRADRAFVVHS
ncbi:MAG: PIN domain-containing protein [Acidimicrobiia bacterium]